MANENCLSLTKILANKDFINFLEIANHYCSITESHQSNDPIEFLQLIQDDLLKLYSLGRFIPDVDLKINSDFDFGVTDESITNPLPFLSHRVPFNYYWTCLDPLDFQTKSEIGCGDLTDDLVDIYKDLKKGILLLEKENLGAKENALFKFKFDYKYHWGEHCIEALNIIHYYLQHVL